jgi:hypothetical protein
MLILSIAPSPSNSRYCEGGFWGQCFVFVGEVSGFGGKFVGEI